MRRRSSRTPVGHRRSEAPCAGSARSQSADRWPARTLPSWTAAAAPGLADESHTLRALPGTPPPQPPCVSHRFSLSHDDVDEFAGHVNDFPDRLVHELPDMLVRKRGRLDRFLTRLGG